MSNETRNCRLCDENNDQMYNIFDKNVFDIQIINMIKDCLPILVYRSDPLSKYICHSCNENLNMFCEFKKSCLDIAKKHRDDLKGCADPKVLLYLKQLDEEKLDDPVSKSSTLELYNEETSDTLVDDSKSQDNSSITSQTSTSCNNNGDTNENTGESDMDIDYTMPNTPAIREQKYVNCGDPILEKPRISGPKSMTNTYTKLIETYEIVYQPLSLDELVVRYFNMNNIPAYKTENWKEQIRTVDKLNYCCRYCEEMFEQECKLAIHEMENHVRLNILKVDQGLIWTSKHVEDFKIRNKWKKQIDTETLEEPGDVDIETFDDNEELLIPLAEEKVRPVKVVQKPPPPQQQQPPPPPTQPVLDVSRNSLVYFVDEIPHVNGIPLKDIPKETRNTYYQGVKMYGAKRKFCQLCRHTFKDNWAIDNHYMSQTCYYTCNYCGQKFKRSKPEFLPHVEYHQKAGHQKSIAVFQPNDRGDIREYDTGCLELYVPPNSSNHMHRTSTIPANTPPRIIPKPTQMTLRVRVVTPKQEPLDQYETPPKVQQPILPAPNKDTPKEKETKLVTVDDLAKNQAYFCKKCYQVFTKLDSYNTHIKTCSGEIDDPEMSLIRHYNKKDGSSPVFCSKVKPPQNFRRTPTAVRVRSRPSLPPPALKPLGQHLLSQSIKIKKEVCDDPPPPDSFPCSSCNAVFKTIYSRNSHMRMHSKPKASLSSSVHISKSSSSSGVKRAANSPMSSAAKKIKQENYEPIVEIHEVASRVSSTIGSVSITPLKKPSNGGALNVSSDIMKLVQNNPNITFKPRDSSKPTQKQLDAGANHFDSADSSHSSDEVDPQKGYKCAFCNQWFGNKSTLYFHKKNTCNGSRFPCPFCKKRFATANEYSSHIFYSHPE